MRYSVANIGYYRRYVMNKKWIWTTISVIVIVLLLVAVGFIFYRMGYMHSAVAGTSEDGWSSMFGRRFTDGDDKDLISGERFTMPFSRLGSRGFMPMHGSFGLLWLLMPIGWLFGLGLFVLFVWLLVKLVRAAWQGEGWKLACSQKKATPVTTVEAEPQPTEADAMPGSEDWK